MSNTIYIIDTNIILHDYNCLYGFGDGDIGIPITVLEEIDDFKKGRDQLNYNAREFTRQIDELSYNLPTKDALYTTGVQIEENRGRLLILVDVSFSNDFGKKFVDKKKDHHILAAAYNYSQNNPDKKIIFVSKDVNLRIKARTLGLEAEDYQVGKIKNVTELTSNVKYIEKPDTSYIDTLLESQEMDLEDFGELYEGEIHPNEFFVLRNNKKSVLARFNPFIRKIEKVLKEEVYGIKPRNAEQMFAINVLLDPQIKLVTVSGTAGTGKTLLALASSLARRRFYKQIYLSRPIVPLSNKDIGYLPGTAQNKIEPYMQPLYDNLKFIQNNYKEGSASYVLIDEMQKYEKLIISPLAYIRGRTLSNVYFIVDEAQNLSPHEVKTIVTRAGEGTKVVLTGDINQIDTPYLDRESNGLTYLIDKMKGQELYAHITLRKGERSELSELASMLL